MIIEENLEKIFDKVIEGEDLTTKKLNEFGFTSKDIKDLINLDFLERIKRGYYKLKGSNQLLFYGKKLISVHEYEKASKCFMVCHEMDPDNLGAVFQLFLRSIQKKEYDKVFLYFEKLLETNNPYYKQDMNYYLLLLDRITDIPEKYKETVKYLEFKDIKVLEGDKRYEDPFLQNRIRILALNERFIYAIRDVNSKIERLQKKTVQDVIEKTLLFQANNEVIMRRSKMNQLLKEKKYEEFIKKIEEKRKTKSLNGYEEYLWILAKKYVEIENTKKIPKKQYMRVYSLEEAIETNNFEVAKEINLKELEKKNMIHSKNEIDDLLNDIISLIHSYEEVKESTVKEIPSKEKSEVPKQVSTMTDIMTSLLKKDIDGGIVHINNYLTAINKNRYFPLISDLLKVSVYEKDFSYTKPLIALTLISNNNYTYDVSNYLKEFYQALSNKELEVARIYLDVIEKGNEISDQKIDITELKKVLEALNGIKEDTIKDEVERTTPKKIIVGGKINQSEKDKEFLLKKQEELKEIKEIIILKSMSDERINQLMEEIEKIPTIRALVIEENGNKRIALRYKETARRDFDLKEKLKDASNDYKEMKYTSALKKYQEALETMEEPKSRFFYDMAKCYLMKRYNNKAIDCLTVAVALARKEKNSMNEENYYAFLLQLKGEIKLLEQKPPIKRNDLEYEEREKEYDLERLAQINSFIVENNLDVVTAGEKLNLTEEEINELLLIYAREFYRRKEFEKGDIFFQTLEKRKGKTKELSKSMEEVRRNKRFYQNRTLENSIGITLPIKPKR